MQTILLASQKGGSGKTSLARNLAVAAARDGKRVMLFDQDPQGSMRLWLERREEDDLSILDEPVPSRTLVKTLKKISKTDAFDLAFVDTAGRMEDWIDPLMSHADLVLTPVKPSGDDLGALNPFLERLRATRAAFAFVLSMTNSRASMTQATARTLAKHGRLAPVDVVNRTVYGELATDGSSVFEARDALATAEIKQLWSYVQEIL